MVIMTGNGKTLPFKFFWDSFTSSIISSKCLVKGDSSLNVLLAFLLLKGSKNTVASKLSESKSESSSSSEE